MSAQARTALWVISLFAFAIATALIDRAQYRRIEALEARLTALESVPATHQPRVR